MDDTVTNQPPSTLRFSVRFAWAFLLFPLTASAADSLILPTPTSDERIEYIRRARVWEPTDVSSKDLYNGPEGKLNSAVDQEITCEFFKKKRDEITKHPGCPTQRRAGTSGDVP
jgi:hypothetical protein